MSQEDLRAALAECDVTKVPDLPQLFAQRFPKADLGYAELRITADDRRLRNDGPRDRIGMDVSVFNGQEVVTYDSANLQASIYDERSLHLVHPGELCAWPRFLESNRGAAPVDRRVERADGKIVVTRKDSRSQVRTMIDEATGFMFHLSFRDDLSGFGRETWQFAPQTQTSGLILAGLSVEISSQNGKLGLVQIHRLDEVDLTAPQAGTFVVSVPAGTNIVDFRGDRQNPKSGVARAPVTDVVMRANAISDRSRSVLPLLKIGQAAPPLKPAVWANADGEAKAPELKGKVVLVDFWATWCGPCVGELPEVQALADQFVGSDLVVIGFHDSGTSQELLSEFATKRRLTYLLAIDESTPDTRGFGATFKAYGIQGIPNCAVIDRDGKIAHVGRFPEAAKVATELLKKN